MTNDDVIDEVPIPFDKEETLADLATGMLGSSQASVDDVVEVRQYLQHWQHISLHFPSCSHCHFKRCVLQHDYGVFPWDHPDASKAVAHTCHACDTYVLINKLIE